jgi:hypothetical protein
VNLGPADIMFELWHNGVKLSKDKPIKVEWQASAPPDPRPAAVAPDFPMNSLPASAGYNMAQHRMRDLRPDSTKFGRKFGADGNGWDKKDVVRSQVMSTHQHGSAMW